MRGAAAAACAPMRGSSSSAAATTCPSWLPPLLPLPLAPLLLPLLEEAAAGGP